jgi:hypothetical protein
MELDVRFNGRSISIPLADPFRLDLVDIKARIEDLFSGASMDDLDVHGLVPLMVRGVAGCEAGCPADAKGLVERGYRNFRLAYVEGGILTAEATAKNGSLLTLKLFPDF